MRRLFVPILLGLLLCRSTRAATSMEVDVAIKTVETTDLDPQARFKAVQKLGELKVVKA
ncbi:MAG: hypothetical protein U0166_03750 [Acidobacteriota bacterium]